MESKGSPKFQVLKLQFVDNQYGVFQAITSTTIPKNWSRGLAKKMDAPNPAQSKITAPLNI